MRLLSRTPVYEHDDTSSYDIMYANANKYRRKLKQLNPRIQFVITFDEKEYPTVGTEDPDDIELPLKW